MNSIQNKFFIITPSFNNENWVEYNLSSVLNQTYTNYEVLYINDASTDNTYNLVKSIVGNNNKFTIINNTENKGAMFNYFEHLDKIDSNSIVVHLDGDDWLYDEFVLDKLNTLYNETNCWMSYGGFVVWDGINAKTPYPQNTNYPKFVHDYKLYRKDMWRASHLRTYRAFLLKSINKNDLRDLKDDIYYWHASDLAFQYPAMEMAGGDKIQNTNFYTHVYNQHHSILNRTREREHKDNSKYEIEIRNRKKYKSGLSGEKLPQINVIGDYKERNSIPTKFSYVYNLTEGEYDVTLIQDTDCIKYINGEFGNLSGKIVADIHEPPYLLSQQRVYDFVYANYTKFHKILTFDEKLLTLPNAIFRNGGYEVVLNKNIHKLEYPNLADDSLIKIYKNKEKNISFITSNKNMTYGHKFRNECVSFLENNNLNIDLYGIGYNEIKGKIDALKEYKFSIVMENGIYKNYFTEKILDCFLTGTIPIYWGCPNISDFFNIQGIYTFNTPNELLNIVNKINSDNYYSKMEFAKENFNKALCYYYNNDTFFEKYIKNLL